MRYADLPDHARAELCDWLRRIGGDPAVTRSVRRVPFGVVAVCLVLDDNGVPKLTADRNGVVTTARFIRTSVSPPPPFHSVAVRGRLSVDGR